MKLQKQPTLLALKHKRLYAVNRDNTKLMISEQN